MRIKSTEKIEDKIKEFQQQIKLAKEKKRHVERDNRNIMRIKLGTAVHAALENCNINPYTFSPEVIAGMLTKHLPDLDRYGDEEALFSLGEGVLSGQIEKDFPEPDAVQDTSQTNGTDL
jgi:hypothetical protein